jgi:hypothetical protein
MTFGYECRPSYWRTIRSNSHLVIAALGTVSFLGVAGVALWLAMPSIERPAFAETRQETNVRQTEAIVSAAGEAAVPAQQLTTQPGTDVITPATAAVAATVAAPAPKDARWKDPNAPDKPAMASSAQAAVNAGAKAVAAPAAGTPDASVSAFAAANRAQLSGDGEHAGAKPDASETSAIPTLKPQQPASKAAPDTKATAKQTAPDSAPDGEGAQGHILHAVTMRSGPKKGAAAMTTVPAKTAVQVLACDQWCEIVYDGKRGWVYKTYVARD